MRDQRQSVLEEQDSQEPASAASSWGKLAIAISIVCVSAYSLQYLDWNLVKEWYMWAKTHPGETLPIFVLLNALAVVLLCPGALVQMFAGAVFGTWIGSMASFIGTFAGQLAAFVLGRYMFRDALAVWMVRRFPSWTTIETALFQQDGAKLVFLLRLSPLLPDSVMNYALALTSIGFSLFATATACSLVPYTVLYCYVGSASKDIMQTIRGGAAGGDVRVKIVASIASAVLFLALLVYLAVVLKRALAKAAAERQAHEAGEFDAIASIAPVEASAASAPKLEAPGKAAGGRLAVSIGVEPHGSGVSELEVQPLLRSPVSGRSIRHHTHVAPQPAAAAAHLVART
eukprot:CAMPEP_0202875774 /NCGR_PEP_ID=MMETSP1391-20130828/27895_1 /ASSEMBLY_ACC=CAM_ASM_000867 /TAXON_ID=1034604 /ORGANISM="Chlamydomonas leiostraca, Strain SAG 11-49" /LENGTH=343 /DNA_ID=CAMNT_0049557505 /DNA_START=44 /DNA_END=1075 /DNA_ORIENTATION=-